MVALYLWPSLNTLCISRPGKKATAIILNSKHRVPCAKCNWRKLEIQDREMIKRRNFHLHTWRSDGWLDWHASETPVGDLDWRVGSGMWREVVGGERLNKRGQNRIKLITYFGLDSSRRWRALQKHKMPKSSPSPSCKWRVFFSQFHLVRANVDKKKSRPHWLFPPYLAYPNYLTIGPDYSIVRFPDVRQRIHGDVNRCEVLATPLAKLGNDNALHDAPIIHSGHPFVSEGKKKKGPGGVNKWEDMKKRMESVNQPIDNK